MAKAPLELSTTMVVHCSSLLQGLYQPDTNPAAKTIEVLFSIVSVSHIGMKLPETKPPFFEIEDFMWKINLLPFQELYLPLSPAVISLVIPNLCNFFY